MSGQNPASLEALPTTGENAIASVDPWRQSWVLSSSLRGAQTAGDHDVWVCSLGPTGQGQCPADSSGRAPGPGSLGYAADRGRWDLRSLPAPPFGGRYSEVVEVAALAGPFVLYFVSRVVRRGLWRPVPTLFTVPLIVAAFVIIGVLAALMVPLYADVAVRARVAKAGRDIREIARAIETFESHVGTLPASMTDLLRPARNARGHSLGPFVATQTVTPPAGWPAYRLRRWEDGRFVVSGSGNGDGGRAYAGRDHQIRR